MGLVELFGSSGPKPSSPLAAFCPQQTVIGVPSSSGVMSQWVTPPERGWETLQPLVKYEGLKNQYETMIDWEWTDIISCMKRNEEYGEPDDPFTRL